VTVRAAINVVRRLVPRDGRRAPNKRTLVYFSHEGESVLENFGNRAARPVDVYRTFLKEVAGRLGVPENSFFWSRKAGCACGCSPGFVCREDRGRDVYVTLSAEAPKVEAGGKHLAAARVEALLADPTVSGAVAAVAAKRAAEDAGAPNF
jgi:hypothetical protein